MSDLTQDSDGLTDGSPAASGPARSSALVVALPARQTVECGPVAVGDVLAQVVELAAFRRATHTVVPLPGFERRCAALQAIGAWRRANPDAAFEVEFAAIERISRQYGADRECET